MSTITLGEVLAGLYKAREVAPAKRYEKALNRYPIVPFSVAVAIQAGQLRARYGLKLPDAAQLANALDMGAAALMTHDRD